MEPSITVSGSKITIGAFKPNIGGIEKVDETTIDLTPYAGRHMRIWLDPDGSYSTDPRRDHLWQVAELTVPRREYKEIETGEIDPDLNVPIVKISASPVDLKGVKIDLFDLPKGAALIEKKPKKKKAKKADSS